MTWYYRKALAKEEDLMNRFTHWQIQLCLLAACSTEKMDQSWLSMVVVQGACFLYIMKECTGRSLWVIIHTEQMET
jgi:hypothetical protein